MAQGCPPWSECDNSYAVLFKIAKGNSPPPFPEGLSAKAEDFLMQCFQIEPKARPNAHKLLQHPFITGEEFVPYQTIDYNNAGLISESFRNFFQKFVEKDFSEKSKSIISANENGQLFNSHNDQIGKERGKSIDLKLADPNLHHFFKTEKSFGAKQLNHLGSQSSQSSSAPLNEFNRKDTGGNEEDSPFANAEDMLSIENTIPVRVIKGGKVNKNQRERKSVFTKKVNDNPLRKTITVYEGLVDDDLDSSPYIGLKYSKTLKHGHSSIGVKSGKFKKEESSGIDTTKDIIKESTFDEGSTFTLKYKDEHAEDSDIAMKMKR